MHKYHLLPNPSFHKHLIRILYDTKVSGFLKIIFTFSFNGPTFFNFLYNHQSASEVLTKQGFYQISQDNDFTADIPQTSCLTSSLILCTVTKATTRRLAVVVSLIFNQKISEGERG